MKSTLAIVALMFLSAPVLAEDFQCADTATADLIEELAFLTPLEIRPAIQRNSLIVFYRGYAAIGVCNGMTIEEANASLTMPMTQISALLGEIHDPRISTRIWDEYQGQGCEPNGEAIKDMRAAIVGMQPQTTVFCAINDRRKEVARRRLVSTELNKLANQISDQIKADLSRIAK